MIFIQKQQGAITLLTLMIILFLTLLATGLAGQIQLAMNHLILGEQEVAAYYAAEAGINLALAEIMKNPQNFQSRWEENLAGPPPCQVVVVIDKSGSVYYIQSEGLSRAVRHKLTATVENFPGNEARVRIQGSFATP